MEYQDRMRCTADEHGVLIAGKKRTEYLERAGRASRVCINDSNITDQRR